MSTSIKWNANTKLLPVLLILAVISLLGCRTSHILPGRQHKPLAQMIEGSPVFGGHFTGFALYDPAARQMLYQYNADRYFTPASNTKIFTFYTALHILGDSLPILHYLISGDTLIFRGAGNPLVLHPDFPSAELAIDFLRSSGKQLFFAADNFQDEHFGPGWAWGDYTYSYQTERSSLPLYGNLVQLFADSCSGSVRAFPPHFQPYLRYSDTEDAPLYRRELTGDVIHLNRSKISRDTGFRASIPYDYRPELAAALLEDTLHQPVGVWQIDSLPVHGWHTLRQSLPDTLYRRLLYPSDNFIAEQLLLMCSDQLFGSQNASRVIEFARDSLLRDLPDPLEWWDGSGLSRYNLFTPRSIVSLLARIYEELPQERIFNLFPTGGISGTIQGWYGGNPPYVFAKTGTLRNKHCLSGYVRTQGGRVLIFSFMHNNFTGSATPVRMEMQRVLELIRSF